MTRFIGIQHRVKMSAEGEARPTRVAIIEGTHIGVKDLKTENDELQFLLNELQHGDVVAMLLGGSGDYLAYALARKAATIGAKVIRIPSFMLKREREGKVDDEVAGVKRTLKSKSSTDRTAEDHILLAQLAQDKPQLFYPLAEKDAALIRARENWRALSESMKARIAGEQRLRQLYIGRVFTRPDGIFPEGGIEIGYDAEKVTDPILSALHKEEARRERDLKACLEELEVYREIFLPIEGVGPKIAGRIIAAVIDIRRFSSEVSSELLEESYARSAEHKKLGRVVEDWDIVGGRLYKNDYSRVRAIASLKESAGKTDEAWHVREYLREMDLRRELRKTKKSGGSGASKLKAYMGVHVLPDGRFARRRQGQIANWHGDARQALFLLGEQFNRRPNSKWGIYLRKMKANLRAIHPEPIVVQGQNGKVKRYSDGHIHKMAMWRTLSRFVESLHHDWTTLENASMKLAKAA